MDILDYFKFLISFKEKKNNYGELKVVNFVFLIFNKKNQNDSIIKIEKKSITKWFYILNNIGSKLKESNSKHLS